MRHSNPMGKVVDETCQLLNDALFDWAFCGGWGIDLFCGRQTRQHGDIDVCVFLENRSDVIKLMRRPNWTLYDYCGGGVVHLTGRHFEEEYAGRNLCCVKDGNEFVQFEPIGDDKFRQGFKETNQKDLDYVDFLFGRRLSGSFVCQWHETKLAIERAMDKAILHRQGIPYVAPEILLLFKSHTDEENGDHDFALASEKMNDEQKAWLLNALKLWHPDGHPWITRLMAK